MATHEEWTPPASRDVYVRAMMALDAGGVPFLVGGTFALAPTAGIDRPTKDLDIFLKPADLERACAVLEAAGLRTEVPFPHWLAKAYGAGRGPGGGPPFVDLIFRSGNGVAEVDDEWFEHATPGEVFGVPARLTPPEESLWSKAFVMERERFDGADVAHMILNLGPQLDWTRLVRRFGPHWRVLLAHLTLFGFIYPAERDRVPVAVLRALTDRLRAEIDAPAPDDPVCQGTLLSRSQYLPDIERAGLADARVEPRGALTAQDVALWTEAIRVDGAV